MMNLGRLGAHDLPEPGGPRIRERAQPGESTAPIIGSRDGAADGLKGDHPFFWAGYMLVDPGVTNADPAATPAPPAAAPPAAPVANAAGAGNGLLPKGLAPPTADATPDTPKPSDKRTGAK